MNNFMYALILSSFAGFSTVIGSLFIFIKIKEKNINKFITFCLAFSLAIMIGVSLFDLLPESIMNLLLIYKGYLCIYLLVIILLAYLLVKLLDKLLKNQKSSLYKIGILSMITLIIHNFPEGIITFLSSYYSKEMGLKLSIAIALHNIPEGIAIAVPIYFATGNKKQAILKSLLSGLSEPIGALLAYLFLAKYISNIMISFILVIVAFLMIILAIEHMFPECQKYKEYKALIIGIIMGLLISFLNFIL